MVPVYEAASVLGEKEYPQNGKEIKYGTAGFRTKEQDLDSVIYRMGLLAVLRSKERKGAAIGAMITASHNPICDNGIKLIEPNGEMLLAQWEVYATMLANAQDKNVNNVLQQIVKECSIDIDEKALVFLAMDTRPSCERLRCAISAGIRVMNAQLKDFGVVSTPLLHFTVSCHNDGGAYGSPSLDGYLTKISSAFVKLRKFASSLETSNYVPSILYDGANGVGAPMMEHFKNHLGDSLNVVIYNKGEGVLNEGCGADFVKSTQKWPNGVPKAIGARCASVDGDADRVMYSYIGETVDQFFILDGDKIGILIARFIKELLEKSGLQLNLGLVQTAYANGASTEYISKKLGVPVACAKTGVKYLHEEALQFDIGIYFEANGHGTIVFNESATKAISEASKDGTCSAACELSVVQSLINETVGDAISDLLLVEHILSHYGWSPQDWNKMYEDLPNTLVKVSVPDRTLIKTTNAERTCTSPVGLQKVIDSIVLKYQKGRSFVRPSGTEDVVRVYAEAQTKSGVQDLAEEVAQAVRSVLER